MLLHARGHSCNACVVDRKLLLPLLVSWVTLVVGALLKVHIPAHKLGVATHSLHLRSSLHLPRLGSLRGSSALKEEFTNPMEVKDSSAEAQGAN